MYIQKFVFNFFEENTYLIWDESGQCAIVDPGCYTAREEGQLREFIAQKQLRPVLHLLTHGHIDHVAGCDFVARTWPDAVFMAHSEAIHEMQEAVQRAAMYGFALTPAPPPSQLLAQGDVVEVGSLAFNVLHTPGHSPGSISFWQQEAGVLISGDVLFRGSIGRTDLTGGNYNTLMHSIFEVLLPLGGEVQVFPGHGPDTTLAHEAATNPFLLQWQRG